jgi:nucleoside-triphosphatase THEP1
MIDELGKMELASAAFRETVERLLHGHASMVATVHVHGHPFTDALKRRLEVIRLESSNRDRHPAREPPDRWTVKPGLSPTTWCIAAATLPRL